MGPFAWPERNHVGSFAFVQNAPILPPRSSEQSVGVGVGAVCVGWQERRGGSSAGTGRQAAPSLRRFFLLGVVVSGCSWSPSSNLVNPERQTACRSGPPDHQDGKNPEARKPWFGRDEKISEQLQIHRQWVVTTRGELTQIRSELERALASIPLDVSDAVATEARLMSNRTKAIKLVLAEPVVDEQDEEHEELFRSRIGLGCS